MAVGETIIFVVLIIAFVIYSIAWIIPITSIIYGKWRLHRKSAAICPESVVGVSVLKPLMGVDPHLYENLESFFTIDYPLFELLFCVEEEQDPSIMVVQSLIQKYPKVNAKLFFGAKKVGVNPKINNLMKGYEAAQYDLLLISDSGIKTNTDTLTDMVTAMTEKTGLVHQMPYVCDRKGFAGVLEKVYFGTQFARYYLILDLIGVNTVTGMSCLLRKEVLEEVGGLGEFAVYLAEDYYLAQTYLDKGWKITISSQPALQNSGYYSVSHFQARMIRWQRLRGAMLPFLMILDPVSECLLQGVLAAIVVTILFNWSGLAFFFVHSLIWFLLDYVTLNTIQNGPISFSKFDFIMAWLFRECTTLSLHIKSHFESVIVWRTRKYYVKWGAKGEEITHKTYV